MERHTGVLENSADLDGELLAALATLLEAVAHDAFRVLTEAFDRTRARSYTRPDTTPQCGQTTPDAHTMLSRNAKALASSWK